jgi:hypothetical protein
MKQLLKFILVALVSANLNAQLWIQIGQDIDGEAGDFSGSVSISADGNTVAIGADMNSGNGLGETLWTT